jgi:RNA polymerase sigma factor (sigma-70 family)
MDDIAQLVTRAQRGDTDAYGELVRRFQDMAYGYAYSVVGDWKLAEDAAQEAFVEAYRCLPTLREPRAFPGWFKRIVFKHCDRLTRGKQVATTPLDAARDVPAHIPGPAAQVETRELQDTVLRAIRALPARQREVTTLYYINGYSQNEIAAFLEVPPSTVKSRLHSSRKQLKERMLDMVRDSLQSSALPESFADQTLAQAVARAAELNREHEFAEAEGLLRDVLGKAPNHVGALRELNRTLMWGQYEDQRFDKRWNELVVNARAILQSGSTDEYVYHELAQTLMYIPRMQEAAEHIEAWIDIKGPNLERQGMLAWVKGCLAEYNEAERLWQDLLQLATGAVPAAQATDTAEVLDWVPYVCRTLVDCFACAGEVDRAQRIVRAAWEHCYPLGEILTERAGRGIRGDFEWLEVFHQAGLPLAEISQALLDRLSARDDLRARGTALVIRAWTDDAQAVIQDWLQWAQDCADEHEWQTINYFALLMAFRRSGRPEALVAWGRAVAEWLPILPQDEAQAQCGWLASARFHYWAYLERDELDAAERLARKGFEQVGLSPYGAGLVDIAALRGEPTPPDVIQVVEEQGIEAIDDYGMAGWYLVAREAAAAGDEGKAFDALERALSYWSNSPYFFTDRWEKDAYWGELHEHPEYERLYREKRERIGPVYGHLHYFPGW